MTMNRTQRHRTWWRAGFFVVFLLAPALNLFRLDLTQGHFIVLGYPWTLGLDSTVSSYPRQLVLRVFLPALTVIIVAFWISWRYGRLYCGWLCPHFSVVEIINTLMRKATGKPSLWDARLLPQHQCDGTVTVPQRARWALVVIAVIFFAVLWSITLLTYLLPPVQVWGNLLNGQPSRNELLFICVASVLLSADFLLARHLFCRYGCAVGFFQSLVWLANPKSLVVGFDRSRAKACKDCDASCEHSCPMRLKPRMNKRHLLACTQCQQCVQACDNVQYTSGQRGLLSVVQGEAALVESLPKSNQRVTHNPNTMTRPVDADALQHRPVTRSEKPRCCTAVSSNRRQR